MRTRAQTAEPTAVDIPYLATVYEVPEPEIQALLDAPTTELVEAFLASLTAKATEFDNLKAEKLRVDVELENTVRTSETKIKAQKATVTKHAKELEELRTKLNVAENARESLSSELEQLRSASSGSTAETSTLRQRIETLEASNRDTLALVETKSAEKDRIAVELSEQHTKLLNLRREINQLEEKSQSLENAASSQKFKEQSMQQEIDMLKRNNEWNSNELQTRNQEFAKFRKERNARIASLQRELEDSTSSVEALKRTETGLRQRLDELQAKADEAFARNASIQEEFARKEHDFRAELDSTKRLADLQAQNAATHKARLQEIQNQVEEIRDNAADELGRLQAEIETERNDREEAERKVGELELAVERLEHQPRLSRAATPLRNGSGDPSTPGRAHSPAMPGSLRKSVGGLSFTQLYSEYTDTKQQLDASERRYMKLSNTLDELMNEMESRTPQITELQEENTRLEGEIVGFTHLLDEAKNHRDKAIKDSEQWKGKADAAVREGEILRQQLRDLSAQVKMLLVEQQSQEQGLGEMTAQERLELERAARGELDDDSLEHLTSTGRLISERLVIFRNINDLQTKNEDLLRITRQLGEQMEGEEAREKARQSEEYAQENEKLKETLARQVDELKVNQTQIDSYMKERDMFRRMLQHRGQVPRDADLQSMFGQSVGPVTPQRNGSMPPPTPRSKDVEDLNKLLKEQQTFYDQYRNESATDRRMLKDQVDALAREKSNIQADLARAQSQLTLATERYEMLQSNYNALRTENSELQKRSQQLAENAAKQDLRTQQVAEELVEARSMVDTLRHENANVKAEKELSKRIETRYEEDIKSLTEERSRLNKLVTDLQNLQNERELTDSETRRRTQSRIESLEAELAEVKKKLEAETEDSRKATLRREYEESQSRTRIDDLVKSLGNVREELVAAKTSRDQLQARVDEMKIELRSAEEKVVALQPRPTPRMAPVPGNDGNENDNEDLPVEQRLAIEVSELRRDLELARNELDSARQQIEQYKAIAQSTEEELASFNETSEQYKDETDRVLAEKESQITQLEQRVEDLSAELSSTNSELSEIRSKSEDHNRVLEEQKANFEAELSRLKDDAERHFEEKKFFQADLKAQAEIAQQAQQAYEDELQKHADAAKSLQAVRKEYNDLRTEVAGIRAEADTAKASLDRGEESWSEQKDRFERELQEAQRRREDVDKQNKLLHQQMESFSSELATLRSGRASLGGDNDNTSSSASGDGSSLQEVIKYLRREKEIVDVQYELSIQEGKRLQQQLDYANGQLEEARQKLNEERRQSADRSASENNTNRLMQTINELNVFRESATTLRNEARQAREKLEEKSKEVEKLVAEIEPLKARSGELEAELESKDGEIKLLQQDRDHWRERTQNIISKYDRVDPAELEEMKKQVEATKAENERLAAERAPLQEQVNEAQAKIDAAREEVTATMNDRLIKFKDQAKDQNRKQNDRIRQLNEDLIAARSEREQAQNQLDTAQNQLNQANASLHEAQSGAAASVNNNGELQAVRDELEQTKALLNEAQAKASSHMDTDEEGQINEDGDDKQHILTLQTQLAERSARAEALSSEVTTLQSRVGELEGQINRLEEQLEIAQAVDGEPGEIPSTHSNSEALEKLKQELTTAQQEVETLRANAASQPASIQTSNGQAVTADAQQVAAEVAKMREEMEQQHALAIKQMEEEHEKKTERLKNNLRRQLADEKEKMRSAVHEELTEQHSQELQKLRDEHNAAVLKLKEEHAAEIERLRHEGSLAVGKTEAAGALKQEDGSVPELTEDQVLDMLKTNARVKSIVAANIRKGVGLETEKLAKVIEQKDVEIASLKEAQASASSSTDAEALKAKVDLAEQEKEAAIKSAVNKVEMRSKVQLSQLDSLRFRMGLVTKAATETPDKTVKEVYDVVSKAKPPPKAAPNAAATASPTAVKAAAPASPVTVQQQTPSSPATQTPEQIEQAKIRARQERFGTVASTSTSTFGQPSTTGLPQPARRSSMAVESSAAGTNPNAQNFTPANMSRSVTTGIPRGGASAGSSLPRGGGAAGSRPGSAMGFQGAASRGGAASGLPRGGGSNIGRGRGGGAGGIPRGGGLLGAGQKRANDGSGGGDDKRQRGPGPSS